MRRFVSARPPRVPPPFPPVVLGVDALGAMVPPGCPVVTPLATHAVYLAPTHRSEWARTHYRELKLLNPGMPIAMRPADGVSPYIAARFDNGVYRSTSTAGMDTNGTSGWRRKRGYGGHSGDGVGEWCVVGDRGTTRAGPLRLALSPVVVVQGFLTDASFLLCLLRSAASVCGSSLPPLFYSCSGVGDAFWFRCAFLRASPAVNAAVKDLAASAAAVNAATPPAFAGNGPPRPAAATASTL